jgi:hypothetical protein
MLSDAAVQSVVDSGPYAAFAYLVFLLLTRVLDRLNKKSRKNRRTGADREVTRAKRETRTDPGA